MLLEYSIKAFQSHFHLMICIEGVFLKGKHFGMLFIIIVKYNNNQIYSLIFYVRGKEEIEF